MSLYYRWKKIYKKNVIGQAINGQSEEGRVYSKHCFVQNYLPIQQ